MEQQQQRRLYFVSDTHHEMIKDRASKSINIEPDLIDSSVKNYLALCGDIGNPFNPNYTEFIQRHTERFERIFVISGNHEYYSNQKQRTMIETDTKILEVVAQFPNVTFLQQSTFQIDDTLIIGCTLWTKVDENAELTMNDYTRIYVDSDAEMARNVYCPTPTFCMIPAASYGKAKKKYVRAGRKLLRFRDILQLHTEMKDWLNQTINNPPSGILKMIVLTHHAPSILMLGCETKEKMEKNSELMPSRQDLVCVSDNCYSSKCETLFKAPVVCWISGHTHKCITATINEIPSMSNCFGYPNQKTGVDLTKYFVF